MRNQRHLARTSVYLGADQLEEMRAVTETSGVPMSVIVRRGVDLGLELYRALKPGRCAHDGCSVGERVEPESIKPVQGGPS